MAGGVGDGGWADRALELVGGRRELAATQHIAWIPDDHPSSRMYHCHLLEHHEAGMMGHFEVVRDDAEVRQTAHRHEQHHAQHHKA